MTIDVLYQGLTIAKGAPFRFEQGGLLVQVDGPMPVATELTLSREARADADADAAENQAPASFTGRVQRVFERSTAGSDAAAAATVTAGMLVFPTTSRVFPRWVKKLLPETAATAGAEFEPEPPPPVAAPEPEAKADAPEAKADATEAKTDDTEAKADATADAAPADAAPADAPASGRTPSEGGETEEEDSKPSAKKPGTASKAKKKTRKR